MPYRQLMKLPTPEEVESVQSRLKQPAKVEIVGTTFGNRLQVSINKKLLLANVFLFYICVLQTLRYLTP